MKVCALASGSKGNSIFVATENTKILIDCGISCRQIMLRLNEIGESPEDIDAIFITHEHSDHIRGLPVFTKKYKTPVFLNKLIEMDIFENITVENFLCGDTIKFKDLEISPYQIPHDATEPVGFIISNKDKSIGIATDIGKVTYLIKEKLSNCSTIFLEFNHDEEMLLTGPYPWHLKQRIRGNYGHLSNRESIELLKEIGGNGLKNIFISHISEQNNSYEKIKRDIIKNLSGILTDKNFYFTYQDKISKIVHV
jgi:phosphoribosyl 1,2-cyclic phosphodiesterase